MIRHDQFESMLVWREELSLADQVRLERHVSACDDCQKTVGLLAENRARLAALTQVRPPAELREAILAATERSRDTLSFYVPVVFAFLSIPMALVAIAVAITFGASGLFSVLAGLGAFACLTTWWVNRHDSAREMPLERDPERLLVAIGRLLMVDVAGLILGGLLFGAVLSAVAMVANVLR